MTAENRTRRQGNGSASLPLNLNNTFLEFSKLIWQLPSWSAAIVFGVIAAAATIRADRMIFGLSGDLVQTLMLAVATFLVGTLTWAFYRFRQYQAAAVPKKPPKPPFGGGHVNSLLQATMVMMTALLSILCSQCLSLGPAFTSGIVILAALALVKAEQETSLIVRTLNHRLGRGDTSK